MKIYFVRHGESECNVKKLINDDPSVPVHLTAKGKKQAAEAAEKLSDMRFDAIYSSPFPRTQETAKILNKKLKLKIIIDERLKEFGYGLEGEKGEKYTALLKKSKDILNFKVSGGESYFDVKARLQDFLEDLRKEKFARVLIVTHETVILVARAILGGVGDEDAYLSHAKNAEPEMFDL